MKELCLAEIKEPHDTVFFLYAKKNVFCLLKYLNSLLRDGHLFLQSHLLCFPRNNLLIDIIYKIVS